MMAKILIVLAYFLCWGVSLITVNVTGEIDEDPNKTSNETELTVSTATLARLRLLLACNHKDFLPKTIQWGEYWVLKNYIRALHGPLLCHETITLTTHATFPYLHNLPLLIERWMGPVSLAIYAPGKDFLPTLNSIRYLRDCYDNNLVKLFVTFHIFFSYEHMPTINIPGPETFLEIPFDCTNAPYIVNVSKTYIKQNGLLYPVNVARNIAKEAATTHYILPSDISLLPSADIIPRFLNTIARYREFWIFTRPTVFLITVYEGDSTNQVPFTLDELQLSLSENNTVALYKFKCPECHSILTPAMNTSEMHLLHEDEKTRTKLIQQQLVFIGTHRDHCYDERLNWEGKKDLITQTYFFCIKNYEFMVLDSAFFFRNRKLKQQNVMDLNGIAIIRNQCIIVNKHIIPELDILYGSNATGRRMRCMIKI